MQLLIDTACENPNGLHNKSVLDWVWGTASLNMISCECWQETGPSLALLFSSSHRLLNHLLSEDVHWFLFQTINLHKSNSKSDGVSDAICSEGLLTLLSVNTQSGISISWHTRCFRGCFCTVLKERQSVFLSDWQHTMTQLWECNIYTEMYCCCRLGTSCKINQIGIKLKWQHWDLHDWSGGLFSAF